MPDRQEVYRALNSERDYQRNRWGEKAHTITEFLTYMRDYVDEGLHLCSRVLEAEAAPKALDIVRKVSALGVACMEQHGAPGRDT